MTPAEILRAAATLIEQNGKATGYFRDVETGAVCAAEAIGYGNEDSEQARHIMKLYLQHDSKSELMTWSDSHTAAEVVAGLRDAAKWSEENG